MTQLWKDPEAISNWFDAILAGLGHRGSSFTNIDSLVVAALTHDGHSRRFLFQEFKRPGEVCRYGQWWALADLARQPNTTVWLVRQCEGLESVEWFDFNGQPAEILTVEAYRELFAQWWSQAPIERTPDDSAARIIWSEYVQHDPSLQQFIAAEIARAGIALDTAQYERDHWKRVAHALWEKVAPGRRRQRPLNAVNRSSPDAEMRSLRGFWR